LPGSPANGDLFVYEVEAGVSWLLRYRTSTTDWEYLGGPPLSAVVTADQNRNGATFADLVSIGPEIDVPLPGTYDVVLECEAYEVTSGAQVAMSYAIGATAADAADEGRITTTGSYLGIIRRTRRKVLTAVTLTAKYLASSSNGNFRRRHMAITPVTLDG
jgi:hypothetical protein